MSDVHRTMAAKMFGVAAEAVTESQRRTARNINYHLMYASKPVTK